MKTRSGNVCLAPVVLLILSCAVVPPVLAQDKALAGQVVDARGSGIAGATVFVTLLVRARRATELRAGLRDDPMAGEATDRVLKSALDGTFSALLPTGSYRIAAFKPGYEVALAEVNLQARNLVQIHMKPADRALADPPEVPEGRDRSLDWILRRSGDDVLRDFEAGLKNPIDQAVLVSDRGGEDGRPAESGMRLPPIDGEFVQGFSGSNLFGGGVSGLGDASGRSTRLALRGAFGEQGSWRFDGLTGRTTAVSAGGEEARAGRTTTGVGIGIDYRLDASDSLKSEVRYATSRYLLDSNALTDGIDQERTNAALAARWDRDLGEDALLYVAGSYLEAAVRQPTQGQVLFGSFAIGEGDAERRADRSVGTAAGLTLRGEKHEIALGLHFHSFRYDLGDGGALLFGGGSTAVLLEAGQQGSAMSLSGEDAWRVADHSVVNYGLGYHNDLTSGTVYVVPRLGWTATLPEAGDLRVRSAVMYRVDGGGTSTQVPPKVGPRDPTRAGTRLGYEIGVERRPEDRLQFAATLSYRPFQEVLREEQAGTMPPVDFLDRGVLVLADAEADRHEMEFEVQRGFGFVRGTLQGSVGRLQGRVSPVLGDGPLLELQAGEARYYLTAMRAMIEPTDTEVRIDYRRVQGEAEAGEMGVGAPVDYRRLDLAVFQDLPCSLIANARWRVLMAYQGLLSDSMNRSGPLPGMSGTSRVTGGVDISF